MKNNKNITRTICEIGLFAALGFVIDELQGILGKGIFVNGGSIGFAMIVVIIIGLRRGLLPAILTGLIIGLFDFATGAYIIHPVQPILDYIIPYALVGIAIFLKPLYIKAENKRSKIIALIVITIAGGLCKFASHYLAGVIFWSDQSGFAWNLSYMNPFLYSFTYNIAFIGPTIVLSSMILVFIELKVPQLIKPQEKELKAKKETRINLFSMTLAVSIILVGLVSAIYFVIDYINSFAQYDYGDSFEFEFNGDSMLISILSIFTIVLGVISAIKTIRNKEQSFKTLQVLSLIILMASIYGLARLLRMNLKNKPIDIYQFWVAISLELFLAVLVLSSFVRRKEQEPKNEIISAN